MAIFLNQKENGYASYADINTFIEKGGEEKLHNSEEISKRIRNSLHDIIRYLHLPKKLPTGEKLFEVKRGRGVVLRNPEM